MLVKGTPDIVSTMATKMSSHSNKNVVTLTILYSVWRQGSDDYFLFKFKYQSKLKAQTPRFSVTDMIQQSGRQ